MEEATKRKGWMKRVQKKRRVGRSEWTELQRSEQGGEGDGKEAGENGLLWGWM